MAGMIGDAHWNLFLVRILAGCLLVVTLFLSGCEERSSKFYLYGPAKSCYAKAMLPSINTCDRLKVYDKLTLHVNRDRQEVVYLQQGLRLDEKNSLFKKLDTCAVVDEKNFSCPGLVYVDGRFINTEVFGDRAITDSYWAYAYSHFLNLGIKKTVLEFIDANNSWITVVVVLIGVVLLLSMVG